MTTQKPVRKSRKNKYTSHACTNCQKKKARCSGTGIMGQPCERCLKDNVECIYLPKKKRRGRRKKTAYASDFPEIPDGSSRSYQQSSTIMSNPSTTLIPHPSRGYSGSIPIPSYSGSAQAFPTLHARRTGAGLDRIMIPNYQGNQQYQHLQQLQTYPMELNSPEFLGANLDFEDSSLTPLAIKYETPEDQDLKNNEEKLAYPSLDLHTEQAPTLEDDNSLLVPLEMDNPSSYQHTNNSMSTSNGLLDFPTPLSAYPLYAPENDETVGDGISNGEVSPSEFLTYSADDDKKFADVTDPENIFSLSTPEKNRPPQNGVSQKPIAPLFQNQQLVPNQLILPTSNSKKAIHDLVLRDDILDGPISNLPSQLIPIARKGVISDLDKTISTLSDERQVKAIMLVQALVEQLQRLGLQGEETYQNTTTFEEENDSFDEDPSGSSGV